MPTARINFHLGVDDTLPALQVQLFDPDANAVTLDIDAGDTVTFTMATLSDGVTKVAAQPATVVDETLGIVQYEWAAADTDTADVYQARFVVTFADGSIETFPGDQGLDPLVVRIA